MAETLLWTNADAVSIDCYVCAHRCHLRKGARGRCGVRVNVNGRLQSVVLDLVSSVQLDPIEKKPLYHFMPGTKIFSMGSVSCNFRCTFCQNHNISVIPSSGVVSGKRTTARSLVDMALQHRAKSIAFTYNEPTISVEFAYEIAELAFSHHLPFVLVSNGYMSKEFLSLMKNRVQAANIDLKSFRESFYKEYCGAKLAPVLESLKRIRSLGWWLEVTTLVIPGVNDSPEEIRDCARFIRNELGKDVPWHLSAFHGAYKMQNHPSTTMEQLQNCWSIGKEEGLEYVYMGNVVNALGGNTFCPSCKGLVCERSPWKISYPPDGKCPNCGTAIPGVWR